MNREERFRRQLDIIHPDKLAALPVTIIGCGAVGSFTCYTLAKMGVKDITVYDADTVEEHNLPNQMFHVEQLGIKKVDAMADLVYYHGGIDLKAVPHHYTREALAGLVICCVDTMDTRLRIWREVKKFKPDLYIDARMGAEVGKVHVVQPNDPTSCRRYEADLYPSSEAFHAPCTAKATVYCAAGLAAYIAAIVAGYVNGRQVRGIVVDWVNLEVVGV
jgi:molybdopterin/thiamine biosynthesis adenylyltransferase